MLCHAVPYAGVLELVNATHAKWAWHRTIDVGSDTGATDQVWLAKPPAGTCLTGRAAAATDGGSAPTPAPAPAPATSSDASSSAHGVVLLLLLGVLAAAATLIH